MSRPWSMQLMSDTPGKERGAAAQTVEGMVGEVRERVPVKGRCLVTSPVGATMLVQREVDGWVTRPLSPHPAGRESLACYETT